MTFRIRDRVGMQPIARTDTVQNHAIGTIVEADDPTYGAGTFIYLAGAASTAIGSWVTYNVDDGSTTLMTASADGPVAVAMSANLASQYGWYQIRGKAVGKALSGFVDDAAVYLTGTAGSVDDAVVAGDRVNRAKGASAVGTPSTGLAEFEIESPFVDPSIATDLSVLDVTAGTGAASKAVVLDANGDFLWPASGVLSLGGTATDGLVAGAGASGSEVELGATAGTALNFRFRGSHTTGDMRGMYLRLDLDGAAASAHGAEALRTFTEIENVDVGVGGTINSIHATMEIDGNSGNIDGAGNVIRATLGGSGTKTLTGTLSGINIHLDLPSAVTLPADLAALRLTKTQDHEWPVFASFDGIVGSGNAVEASAKVPTGAATHAFHFKVDGTSVYVPGYDDVAFNADD